MGKWIAWALASLPSLGLACEQGHDIRAGEVAAPASQTTPMLWLQAHDRPLPVGWPAPTVHTSAPPAPDTVSTRPAAPNAICRRELRRRAMYPDSIRILKASPTGAPPGTTGLVYLFAGKNRLGWNSQWRTRCEVAADGELQEFRTVLVPQ